jgi:diguanylate cyclase (GGDEF)-like protein
MEIDPGEKTPAAPLSLGTERDRVAEERDRSSASRDHVADARDRRATRRDDRAEARELLVDDVDPNSALDRAAARRDRRESAAERTHSLGDRVSSDADRILSARERTEYLVDELTGAHRRAAGLFEIEREVIRARRTQQHYTLAFIDVDGLKAVNDSRGHAAGDEILVLVADTIRDHVRPYDLIVRYGGDEFLCGLLGLDRAEVRRRFDLVNVELSLNGRTSVTAGLAEFGWSDSVGALIRRADEDLYERRRDRKAVPT